MNFIKKALKNTLILLGKRNTGIGRIVWFLNGACLIFYLDSFLYILLTPYGFLNQFIIASLAVLNFLIAFVVFCIDFKPFLLLDKTPLGYHILFLLSLALIYITTIKYIWTHKKDYIKIFYQQ